LNFIASTQLIEVESINNLLGTFCKHSTLGGSLCLQNILQSLHVPTREDITRRVLFLSLGNASMTTKVFDIQQLPSESFRIKSICLESLCNENIYVNASDSTLHCSSLLISNGSRIKQIYHSPRPLRSGENEIIISTYMQVGDYYIQRWNCSIVSASSCTLWKPTGLRWSLLSSTSPSYPAFSGTDRSASVARGDYPK